MKHEITEMQLYQHNEGTANFPSELGNYSSECNVRQFLLQCSRLYSKVAMFHQRDNFEVNLNHYSSNEIFGINIKFKPNMSLEDFVKKESDNENDFFKTLLQIISYSDMYRKRGNRAVFLTYFSRKNVDGEDVLVAKAVVSTTIFYNDYRATLGFPSNEDEMNNCIENIYNKLCNNYPEFSFELEGIELDNLSNLDSD